MTIFFVISVGIASLLFSRFLFGRWFNHLSIYALSWTVMISLYELKLMLYINLSVDAWMSFGGAFLCFLFGIITIFVSRTALLKSNTIQKIDDHPFKLFADDGKILKLVTIFLGTVGLLAALHNWYILIDMFGSLEKAIINLGIIYKLRIQEEIPGLIPYVSAFGFAAVFIGGILAAYKGRITLISIYPIIGVILKEFAMAGRAGILIAFIQFFSAFLLFKALLKPNNYFKSKRNKIGYMSTIILTVVLFVVGVSLIRSFRGSIESFSSSTKQLNQLREGVFITPSIYLYFSSHVGVYSKYISEENEETSFGENTFSPVYRILSKFEFVEQPSFYQKGYLIPMWTNTGTYLRELHADFGISAVFIVPYLLGLITTFFWFRFFEKKKISDMIILTYLYVIISFSFLTMITRMANWWISLILLLVLLPLIEKLNLNQNRLLLK